MPEGSFSPESQNPVPSSPVPETPGTVLADEQQPSFAVETQVGLGNTSFSKDGVSANQEHPGEERAQSGNILGENKQDAVSEQADKELRVNKLKEDVARLKFDIPGQKIPEIKIDPATGEDLSSNEEKRLQIQKDIMLERAEDAMDNELLYSMDTQIRQRLPRPKCSEDGKVTSESLEARMSIFREGVKVKVDAAKEKGLRIFKFDPHTGDEIPQDSLRILRQIMRQENISGKIQRSLSRDMLDHFDGSRNLEDSPHIIERLSESELENFVGQLSEFYHVPQPIRENGQNTEVFIVRDDSFTATEELKLKVVKKEIRDNLKNDEEKAQFDQDVAREAERIDGINGKLKDGKRLIQIRESRSGDKAVLAHEILHSMAKDAGLATRDPSGTIKNDLDEAVTEALALHFVYPDLDLEKLAFKVPAREIDGVGYRLYVSNVLLGMYGTEIDGKNPFTFQDLAKYYFGQVNEGASHGDRAVAMLKDIESRIPPQYHDNSVNRLAKLF